ncbi:MAG: aconitate hydratase, partial [Gemmatimonadota bacterium]|nr:aconitate hydratase [Gemmatimonadota bacterium]
VLDPLPSDLSGPVLIKLDDDISTDEILPAGSEILPFRSNIEKISEFTFHLVDGDYVDRALERRYEGEHFIVGGSNYGQGSSREHAALAPRHLGVRAVIAKDYARIHAQNLANFGIPPLRFADPADYDRIHRGDELEIPDIRRRLENGEALEAVNRTRSESYPLTHDMAPRQVEMVLAGSVLTMRREAPAA